MKKRDENEAGNGGGRIEFGEWVGTKAVLESLLGERWVKISLWELARDSWESGHLGGGGFSGTEGFLLGPDGCSMWLWSSG